MAQGQKFFDIVMEGRFNPANINVSWAPPGLSLVRTEASEAYLAQRWKEHLDRGNKPWPNDLKPTRVRLAGFKETKSGAEIILDPCIRYYDSLGANSPEFEKQFGRNAVPNALAVSVFLETADGHMGVSVRNKPTDYKHRGYHLTMGGYFTFCDYKDAARADKDPTSAALGELGEEVGVTKDDLTHLDCIGAVYDKWAAHTDIVYHAQTGLTAAEVLKRRHDDENLITMVPSDQEHFELFLGGFMHANVVIPMATLLMIGTERFGQQWRAEMLNTLADGSKCYDDPAERLRREAEDTERFQQYIEKQHLLKAA